MKNLPPDLTDDELPPVEQFMIAETLPFLRRVALVQDAPAVVILLDAQERLIRQSQTEIASFIAGVATILLGDQIAYERAADAFFAEIEANIQQARDQIIRDPLARALYEQLLAEGKAPRKPGAEKGGHKR